MGILIRLKRIIYFLLPSSKEPVRGPFVIKSQDNINAGRDSYHNGNFVVKGSGILRIGNYCAFGTNITIVLSNHNISYPSMQYTFYRKNFKQLPYNSIIEKTFIGSDVWIGDNVLILPNVKVGNGAVIGGGSVVTKDVEPFTIVAGNPAKIIKKRFPSDKIIELEQLKWWNWDEEKIKDNQSFFFTNLNE